MKVATKATKGTRTMKGKALTTTRIQSGLGPVGNSTKTNSTTKALNWRQKKKMREEADSKADDVKATADAVMEATTMKSMKARAAKASSHAGAKNATANEAVKAMRSVKANNGVSARSRKHEVSVGKFAKRVSLKTTNSNKKKRSEQKPDKEDDDDEPTATPPAKKARTAQKLSAVIIKKRMEAAKKNNQDESDDDDDDEDDAADDDDDDDDNEGDEVDEEDRAAEMRKELKSMDKVALKKLLDNKGLEARTKREMVDCLVAQAAKDRKELKAHTAKAQEVLGQRRTELQGMPNPDLKELCQKNNLKLGGTKEDRVERLLAFAEQSGVVEQVLASQARESRREELLRMDKAVLSKLCDKAGVNPFVKEVMVERILAYESAAAPTKNDVERLETLVSGTTVKKMMKAMKAR